MSLYANVFAMVVFVSCCTRTLTATAQPSQPQEQCRVIAFRGNVILRPSNTPVTLGMPLALGDTVVLERGAYCGVAHGSGATRELPAGTATPVAEIVRTVPKPRTGIDKLVTFVVNKMISSTTRQESSSGGVTRGALRVLLPRTTKLIDSLVVLQWSDISVPATPQKSNKRYVFWLTDAQGRIRFQQETNASFARINMSALGMQPDTCYWWSVKELAASAANQTRYCLNLMNTGEAVALNEDLEHLSTLYGNAPTALDYFFMGALFEAKGLYYNALNAYRTAAKVGKQIPAFTAACSQFLRFMGIDAADEQRIQDIPPSPTSPIRGIVKDTKNNPLRDVTVKAMTLDGKQMMATARTDAAGHYELLVESGEKYILVFDRDGFVSMSSPVDLAKPIVFRIGAEPRQIIVLPTVSEARGGMPITLNNVLFDFNKDELRPESYLDLKNLARILKEYPNARVELRGHTDDIGTDEYNKKLSLRRAERALEYLRGQLQQQTGSPSKIALRALGFGKTQPLDSSGTNDGRTKNRRVEFRFVK
jgi:outer membrane protein OmpA-like peptidoglycan-associated protein